jgi:hypothetical protein
MNPFYFVRFCVKALGIPPEMLAAECKKLFQGGTSVQPLPGKNQKHHEVRRATPPPTSLRNRTYHPVINDGHRLSFLGFFYPCIFPEGLFLNPFVSIGLDSGQLPDGAISVPAEPLQGAEEICEDGPVVHRSHRTVA